MSLNNHFFSLFSNINNGISANKNKIKHFKSKKVIQFLHFLLKLGYIQTYKYSLKNKIIFIYLKNSVKFKLQYVSKPSKKKYINHKKLLKKKGFYIISSNKGLFTNFSFSKTHNGGEIICQIL